MSVKQQGEIKSVSVQRTDVAPEFDVTIEKNTALIALKGFWNTHHIHLIDDQLRQFERCPPTSQAVIDVGDIGRLDTSGALLIERLSHHLKERGVEVAVVGVKPSWQLLLQSVGRYVTRGHISSPSGRGFGFTAFLDWIGQRVVNMGRDFLMAMHILGATIRGSQLKMGKVSGINPAAIITQMDRMGVGAVPVIVLISFIVGAIIAQQGAFQLRYFGAEIFVVDLVGILVFRELGVLMTAIMIAGRSGSAITAEIGSMKMREETDALTVMGLDPVAVLVFPRLVALAFVLPLLTIIADLAALMGAALVALVYSNIALEAFLVRLNDAVWLSTYLAGLIKAPFMALIIGIIAAVEGMKVGGSAESLGRRVTSSVVKSIFVVVVVDGFFAIFYATIDF